LRLPTGFKIPHEQRFDFAYEKSQLLKILEVDWNARTADAWRPRFTFPDGKTEEHRFHPGETVYMPAGSHLPENLSDQPLNVILVELKR
jgi:hypothetical protein